MKANLIDDMQFAEARAETKLDNIFLSQKDYIQQLSMLYSDVT